PGVSALAPSAPALRRGAHGLGLLWRFSRPHTIVGTLLSVLGLYVVTVSELPGLAVGAGLGDLAWTLLAGLCVNVFIVGLNQLEDIEIDQVNKPWLPVAAGELTVPAARRIVALCGAVPVVLAVTQGAVELAAVLCGLLVGVAYSSPPLRLKRWPTLAALAISGVRAVVVNLGVALHFSGALAGQAVVVGPVWALTLFVLPFSLAIAVLKDVPDLEGDRRYAIATFTVRLGPARAHRLGLGALTVAYLGMALAGPPLLDGVHGGVLAATHLVALGVLWAWARGVDPSDPRAYTRFYLRVWLLFFCEYLVVPLAAVAA
ncbi:MAG: homogentisate phytyltransferase, partial [Actinomycetota bacterium]|nr:homogentisate phytyltransferase [Actinomycetota bacterium]